mgnify:CR=1 FL=1
MKLRSSNTDKKSYSSLHTCAKNYNSLKPYSLRIITKTRNDKKFNAWMNEVEKEVYSKINIALIDLPDENYRMLFDDKINPIEMALIVTKDYYMMMNFFKHI